LASASGGVALGLASGGVALGLGAVKLGLGAVKLGLGSIGPASYSVKESENGKKRWSLGLVSLLAGRLRVRYVGWEPLKQDP